MGYTTSGIRNIALVGQAGAGKTSLIETLLVQAGAIRSRGSLARGTTVSDFDPQEKRLQHSLDTAICSFDLNGTHLNLIDTPGYPDFLGKTLSVLEAVDAVAIVVSAVNGVDAITRRLMDFARERELCRVVIINKIDSRDAHCEAVLTQLREAFGAECLPLNLPAGGGDSVVDCFFQPHGRAADFSSVETAHTQIIDQVVELDEALMTLYLGQGEELSRAVAQSLRAGAARGAPRARVLRVSRGRRRRSGTAADIHPAHAEPHRGQSAALPQGHG